jgi:hypothetical protein
MNMQIFFPGKALPRVGTVNSSLVCRRARGTGQEGAWHAAPFFLGRQLECA